MTESLRRMDPFARFVTASCLVLALLVVLLVVQNPTLRADCHPQVEALGPGDQLQPITLVEDSGRAQRVDFGKEAARTVLLVFTMRCPACRETLPAWADLLSGAPAPGARVIGIQMDRLKGSAEVPPPLPFPVYGHEPRRGDDPLAGVTRVPATVLVDENGVVEETVFGVPTERQLRRFRQMLSG